ncbi:hypothetical protein [Streptosporangium sp. NPDC002524]|uniref:hypothetical protein n=1 Tax=Streptosporangium sp. NPDC002524 TaxID=3154537 RepID=UPI003324B747
MTGETVLPLLRAGRWYRSMDTVPVPGGPLLSLAPEIMVRDDSARLRARRAAMTMPSRARRLELLREAVALFRHGRVPVESLGVQDTGGFEEAMRATAGLPPALVRRWSGMLAERLEELAADAPDADAGADVTAGGSVGVDGLTLVSLPANTFTCLEGVLEAALSGAAVWIRPSRREPLSSARLVGALLSVGWPPETLGYYPSAPRTLPALIRATDRQIVYGGDGLAAGPAAGAPSLDLRGPGRACVIVGAGEPVDPEDLAARIARDAGRFCTCACTVVFLRETASLEAASLRDAASLQETASLQEAASLRQAEILREIGAFRETRTPWDAGGFSDTGAPWQAEADARRVEADAWRVAEVLDGISLDPPDPRWPQASWAEADAARMAAFVSDRLAPGGRVLTRRPLLVRSGGATFLAPTLVHVDDVGHPLVGCELPFPLAVVVSTDEAGARGVAAGSRFVHRARFATVPEVPEGVSS